MAVKSYALTTLAKVKDQLDITSGDTTNNAVLEQLINAATDTIERYCGGRRFKRTTYTNEKYDGNGDKSIKLRHWPVTTLTSFQFLTGDFGSDNWEDFDSDFYNIETGDSRNGGVIYSQVTIPKGVDNIRVTYVAGGDIDGADAIPDDIDQACIDYVVFMFNKRKAAGVKSESLGDRSITYFEQKGGSPIDILGLDEILDQYRDFKF